MKTATGLLLVSLLLVPGCFIFDLAFNIIGIALDLLDSGLLGALLFFAPPPPDGTELPAAGESVPIDRALALAGELRAVNTPVLIPPETAASFDPGRPPVPGTVLYAFPVTGRP